MPHLLQASDEREEGAEKAGTEARGEAAGGGSAQQPLDAALLFSLSQSDALEDCECDWSPLLSSSLATAGSACAQSPDCHSSSPPSVGARSSTRWQHLSAVLFTALCGSLLAHLYTGLHYSAGGSLLFAPLYSPTPQPRTCHSALYAAGEWLPSDSEWYVYLVGDSSTLSCDASSLDTIWQFNATERLLTTVPPNSSLLNSSQLYVRPALKYVWTPSSCELHRFPLWQPVEFCLALSSRPLLFVGDSVSYQQYQSLLFMLGDVARDEQFGDANSDSCVRLLDAHYTQLLDEACAAESLTTWPLHTSPLLCASGRWVGTELPAAFNSSHVRIRFVRNDFLSDVSASIRQRVGRRTDVESPWRHLVGNDTLLVINTGVHVVEPAVFRERLVEVMQWMRREHPCATVLWRSSVPGHADCNSAANQLPLSRRRYQHFDRQDQMLHRGNLEYGWERVRELNHIARQVLLSAAANAANSSAAATCPSHAAASSTATGISTATAGTAGFRVGGFYELDVDSFDKLRPDGHRPGDCLHQCLPGPVDTWNRLLYNMLIGQAS